MRAIVLARHGSPEDALEVQERPEPAVGRHDVRVRVRAAGLNFADILARVGLYPDAPKPPCVIGYEVAGEVESVGPEVTDFEPGQPVAAATRFNGFAELAATPEANVVPLPDGMSFEQGAALPVNYATAYAAVSLMASVRAGEAVVVQAAAGGVGIAAVQLLRARDAEVIGAASASKHDALREQGAAHVIDYRTQDLVDEVQRITRDRGADVVLDSLGEFRRSYSMLRPGGRLVMYGSSKMISGDRRNIVKALKEVATMPRFGAMKLMNENRAVMGLNLLHWWDERGSIEELARPLIDLAAQGVIRPVVAESFPFERAADAHRFIQERRNIGKVVLTP